MTTVTSVFVIAARPFVIAVQAGIHGDTMITDKPAVDSRRRGSDKSNGRGKKGVRLS